MSIASAVTRVIGWTLGIYLLLWIAATLIWPVSRPDQPLDAHNGEHDLYFDNWREVVYSLPAHCGGPPKKHLILLGSSSALAFRPEILSTVTDAAEVDNLALSQSNITQIRQLVTDVQRCLGPETIRSSTFVIIMGYFLFVDNARRWDTDFTFYEAEKLRFGLYSGGPRSVIPNFGPSVMPWVVEALKPVFALSWLKGASWNLLLSVVAKIHPTPEKNFLKNENAFLKMLGHLFPKVDGAPFGDEQFKELDGLVSDIRASGAGLIFVLQPSRSFERNSEINTSYWSRIGSFTADHRIPVIDISTAANDSTFKDPYHASDGNFVLWTRLLADKLKAPGAAGTTLVKHQSG